MARLVCLGQTSRQIADVLYLSPRTVEQHVANVMRKQGVSSRDQIRLTDEGVDAEPGELVSRPVRR